MTPADIAWKKWRATAPEAGTQTAFHAGFAAAIEECAKVALAHRGSYDKRRDLKIDLRFASDEVQSEIQAEQRGEDIAAEMIATAILALKAPQAEQEK